MASLPVSDCVVVGAGPAGLAVSAALAAHGVEHVVLERDRVAETWRTQRWDSFRLNTPGWMNQMLGEQAHREFLDGAEVIHHLEALAAERPVRQAVRVDELAASSDGYVMQTEAGVIRARSVIVATGDQNVPRLPPVAQTLPDSIAQYHTGSYRGPGSLPAGGALVVGSAQSGCQIAEDLLCAGRRVVIATSPAARLPWRHRGRDSLEWLVEALPPTASHDATVSAGSRPGFGTQACAGSPTDALLSCSASPTMPKRLPMASRRISSSSPDHDGILTTRCLPPVCASGLRPRIPVSSPSNALCG